MAVPQDEVDARRAMLRHGMHIQDNSEAEALPDFGN